MKAKERRLIRRFDCAHYHTLDDAAGNSGLYLEYYNQDALSLGFYKAPVAAGNGSGGRSYSIVPGDPDASILVYRMEAFDPEIRMPELGRSLVDEEGVKLIRGWIERME